MPITSFKGIDNIGEVVFAQILRDNVASYIDWSFLAAGAFFNIRIPTSGAFGGNRERLRPVVDPRYTDGRVWEAYRKNWVWETNINDVSSQPISISGIYINNSFRPINSGYFIDYPNGRIVFDSGIALNSTVKVEYSHKWVSTVTNNTDAILNEIQYRSFRVDDTKFIINSGVWNTLADMRVQLPAIIIEQPITREYQGYQLGNGQYARPDIIMHVLAEDSTTATKISNILSLQKDSTILIFDSDRLGKQNKLPLDYRGTPISGAMTYPQLIAGTGDGGFRYFDKVQNGQFAIVDTEEEGAREINQNLYHSPVRWTVEAILLKI